MTMRIKFAATKVAAWGRSGGRSRVPFVASMSAADGGPVRLAALGAPTGPAATAGGWSIQPQDPPPPGQDLPTPEQLSNLCNQVTDPGVSYTTKTGLVENGIAPDEGHLADHELRKAYREGKFPETFAVTNIAPAGPNAAQADVAISGPKFAGPVSKHLMFLDQGGNWILQHDSAIGLLQAATG